MRRLFIPVEFRVDARSCVARRPWPVGVSRQGGRWRLQCSIMSDCAHAEPSRCPSLSSQLNAILFGQTPQFPRRARMWSLFTSAPWLLAALSLTYIKAFSKITMKTPFKDLVWKPLDVAKNFLLQATTLSCCILGLLGKFDVRSNLQFIRIMKGERHRQWSAPEMF